MSCTTKVLTVTSHKLMLLYHGQTLDEAKLIVPETLILPIIKMHHSKVFAGHQGIKRTRDLLKLY
jgi:hypothetical protein